MGQRVEFHFHIKFWINLSEISYENEILSPLFTLYIHTLSLYLIFIFNKFSLPLVNVCKIAG